MKKFCLLAVLLGFPLSAVSQVPAIYSDSLDFGRMSASSPSEILLGRISGVRVSSSQGGAGDVKHTFIRGLNSVRGSAEPLWVIDGVALSSSPSCNLDAFWQGTFGELTYTSSRNAMSFINPYDIESIEVVKDLSAAASYGAKGANGVILVKTFRPSAEGTSVRWNSNAGVDTDASGTGFGPSFSHNHSVSVSSLKARNSYRVSAFLRSRQGVVPRDNALDAGVGVSFDASASDKLQFSVHSLLGAGNSNSPASTSWYGQESAMQLLRAGGDYDSFISDHDDGIRSYRSVNDVSMKVGIFPWLKWTTDFAVDFLDATRYVWYGNLTSFGAANNGAASIMTTSEMEYTGGTRLSADFYPFPEHHLHVAIGAEASGTEDKYDTMDGTGFFNHELRAKGLSYHGGKPELRKFDIGISRTGLSSSLSWNFRQAAGISASLRMDNTSRYDDGRFTAYPSAEAFLDVLKIVPAPGFLSRLRFEAGYGKAGREFYAPYEMFPLYCPGLVVSGVQDGTESLYEGLGRLVSGEWHAGLDMGLLGGRISISMAAYGKRTSDRFSWYCFGYGIEDSIRWRKGDRRDLGSVESLVTNSGVELDLAASIIESGSLRWTVNANAAFRTGLGFDLSDEDSAGRSFGAGVKYAAVLSSVPKVHGGLSSRLLYGPWAFDLAVDGAAGRSILNLNRMPEEGGVAASCMEKADFLRLGSIALSRDLDLGGGLMKALRFTLEIRNPFVLTSYSGYNPDVDSYSDSAFLYGADYASFPMFRSFLAGASLTF